MLARTQSERSPSGRCAVSSISKTDYILWRDCAKNAWLRIHKPDVYFSTELTEYEQSVMEMGIEVERVARGLFPDGAVVTGSQTDALQETRALIRTPMSRGTKRSLDHATTARSISYDHRELFLIYDSAA